MKIRYPGPNVAEERRTIAEYVQIDGGLPLPVGEAVVVPAGWEPRAEALVDIGMVERVAEDVPPPAPALTDDVPELPSRPTAHEDPAQPSRRRTPPASKEQ